MSDTKDTAPPGSSPPSGKRPEPRRRPLYPKAAHRRPHKTTHISTAAVKNEINVTPLVDVVLVLLIIFMVVTPMLSRGVKVELPETINHEKKQDTGEQLIVSIKKDGSVYVEGDAVKTDEFEDRLRLGMKAHSGFIMVKADRRLDYGDVRKVLEQIHNVGAPSVVLGTEELKTKGGP